MALRLQDNGIKPTSFNGANESVEKTNDGQLAFANKRAEAWWKFREALDPDQPDGSAIALPPDPELRADLCAPAWKLTQRGILLESKSGSSEFGNLRQRLGRSPGRGDAVVMAWSEGEAAAVSRRNAGKWEHIGSGGKVGSPETPPSTVERGVANSESDRLFCKIARATVEVSRLTDQKHVPRMPLERAAELTGGL